MRQGQFPPQSAIRPWVGVGELVRDVAPRPLKHCYLCGEWLPLSDFGRDASRADGLTAADRACLSLRRTELDAGCANRRLLQREYRRRWNEAHADQLAVYQAAYRVAHRERRLAQSRAWNAAYPEARRAACRRFRARVAEATRNAREAYTEPVGRSDANSDNMRSGHRRASTSSVAISCLEVEAP